MEPSATMAHVEQFLCRPRERRVCKGIAPFDRQRLLPLQCLFAPHYWHETVATLRYRREGALWPYEPSSVLSYGKETEHGSTSPYA
jgi:hypothetical protein